MLKYTFWLTRMHTKHCLRYYRFIIRIFTRETITCANGRNGRGRTRPHASECTFEILTREVEYRGIRTEKNLCNGNDQVGRSGVKNGETSQQRHGVAFGRQHKRYGANVCKNDGEHRACVRCSTVLRKRFAA